MRNEFLGEKPGGSFTKKSFQHVKERSCRYQLYPMKGLSYPLKLQVRQNGLLLFTGYGQVRKLAALF